MSIYEEKNGADVGTGGLRQSSRVGFGGGGGGGGGDDEAGQDGEVVIPDWGEDTAPTPPESDAAAGPAQCIAEFKAKREKREGVALGAVLIFLLVVAVSTVVGILMMMYNKNPATNPFFEEVDGSAALTPTGVSIYLALWFCKILVSSAIVSMPLDLEAMASEVRWADIAAGRVPQLVSVGAWAFFIVMEIVGGVGIYLVYGWCSCLLLPLIYLKLAVWKFEFAQEPVQPGEKHLLLRQPTCWEFQTLVMGAYACTIYPGFGLWCIHDGQWDGKTVGRFGGLALVLLQWALVVFWWMKRARHVFHAGAPEGMNRQTLCAETLLWAYTLLPMTQVLFHPFLWPDMPDNADMITMQGRLVPGSGQGPWDKPWDTSYYLYNAVEACVPSLLFLVFRRQIYNALKAPFLTKQRLQDGAFIATLLAEDDADDMIGQATELFRGIAFSKVSAELLRSSKGSAEEYKLSRPCKLNSVDFFVSHSWSDDVDLKYAHLATVAADFEREHGREPILWLDKVCIDQSDIARALKCLPVFVFSCKRLLILAGNTYCDRLWCVWELYTFFSTSGKSAIKRVELVDFSDAGTSTLLTFDVANAHCYSPEDEAKLRSIIESGGASVFNAMIREVGAELQQGKRAPNAVPV